MRQCTKFSNRIPPQSLLQRVPPPLSLSLFPSCVQHRFLCPDPPLCCDCNSADISLLTTASGPFRVARSNTSVILGCAAHPSALDMNCHVVHSAACPVNGFGLPRVRVSMTPADAPDAPPPEDILWIRCWAAANACSAEPCLCRACTASLSRLTNLASNSSVVMMYYRRST